tara:strand:+ start:621 stop:797 length:177 start_codon:yes stop_codon:yes gene_type:complete
MCHETRGVQRRCIGQSTISSRMKGTVDAWARFNACARKKGGRGGVQERKEKENRKKKV